MKKKILILAVFLLISGSPTFSMQMNQDSEEQPDFWGIYLSQPNLLRSAVMTEIELTHERRVPAETIISRETLLFHKELKRKFRIEGESNYHAGSVGELFDWSLSPEENKNFGNITVALQGNGIQVPDKWVALLKALSQNNNISLFRVLHQLKMQQCRAVQKS